MAEYYFSLDEQKKFYGVKEEPKPKNKRKHRWTYSQNAVIYTVWALQANKPGVNPRKMAGGVVKYEMEEMVQMVRTLARGELFYVSDEAILCQLTRCGYTLMETENGFTDKRHEEMFLYIHDSLKIWNGKIRLKTK